jgi:flagellar protein FliO/FliZ
MIELVVRLVFSLAVVVGLLLLLAKLSANRFRGSAGAFVHVVHRQTLSRSSALAVVTVGSRVLVLGTTEQQVQLLTELDADELDLPDPTTEPADEDGALSAGRLDLTKLAPSAARSFRRMRAVGAARASENALAGSLLSAHTGRQAFTAASGGNDRDAS